MGKLRWILVLSLALVSVLPSFAQTAFVSADLKTVLGAALQGDSFVRFRLRNYSGNVPHLAGASGVIVSSDQDVYPDASGHVSTSLYRNDFISPNGTFYTVEYWSGGLLYSSANYLITTSTADLNTKTPITAAPVIPPVSPTPTDQVYARRDGGNSPFTGPISVPSLNSIRFADQFGSIDAAVTDCGSNPCIVIIPSNYIGPESVNLVTVSTGYKVYNGPNNVTVIDHRANPTFGTQPNYGIMYGGRLAGQLQRLGVNYYATGTIPDSTAAGTFVNWLGNATLPVAGGDQFGLISSITTHDSVTVGASPSVIAAIDAEVNLDATSSDAPIKEAWAITAAAHITRTGATQNVLLAGALHGIGCGNISAATFTKCWVINADLPGTATSEAYSLRIAGNWITENATELHARDSGGIPRVSTGWTSGNETYYKPLSDSVGWNWYTQGGSGLFSMTSTLITSKVAHKFAADITPTVAGTPSIGNTSLPWSGLYIGASAGNTAHLTGTFTGNRAITIQDANGTVPVLASGNSNDIAMRSGTPTAGHAACIKTAGPPITIGYCSTAVDASGNCTCN